MTKTFCDKCGAPEPTCKTTLSGDGVDDYQRLVLCHHCYTDLLQYLGDKTAPKRRTYVSPAYFLIAVWLFGFLTGACAAAVIVRSVQL